MVQYFILDSSMLPLAINPNTLKPFRLSSNQYVLNGRFNILRDKIDLQKSIQVIWRNIFTLTYWRSDGDKEVWVVIASLI